MIEAGLKSDVEKFKLALRAKKAACLDSYPEILNHAARNVAFMSASFTPKANPARIRADLMRDPHLRFALTSVALRKKGIGILSKPQFGKAVLKYLGRRVSSANYLRAAWANSIEQMGGTFKGRKLIGADGFANKAQAGKFVAQLVAILSQPDSIHAASAEGIMQKATWDAIRYVTEDMLVYARRKLGQAAGK